MAAEHYKEAMTIDEYISSMREKRERFLENIERTTFTPEQLARFGDAPLRILVVTEDWCSDSVQFVPMVVKLARELPDAEVRVLLRDQHRDLANNYRRKDGYQAIPVFILFDGDLREIGSLVERPARVAAEIAAETRRFQKANPHLPGINRMVDRMPEETRAAVKANNRRWRVGQFDRWMPYLVEELAAIIEAARNQQAA